MTTFEQDLKKTIEAARNGAGYRNYLDARTAVFQMIENGKKENFSASSYWNEELAGLKYMFDAPPLIIESLRHHSHHFTGDKEYAYRSHHIKNRAKNVVRLKKQFSALKNLDTKGLFVPESPILGGYGIGAGKELYNLDTLRYYEAMISMEKGGALSAFKDEDNADKKIILEIGSGWGGFAYQFKTLFPGAICVLVDFPAALLFAATYLMTAFPESKALLFDGRASEAGKINPEKYDFLFIPNFAFKHLEFRRPDLIVNTASFQEMTEDQLDGYLKKAKQWGVPNIYSWNRGRSMHNPELMSVDDVLRRYYDWREIKIFGDNKKLNFKNILKRILRKDTGNPAEYRHLIGKLPE